MDTMTTNACCAECGEEGGFSLKSCKACMQVEYCNANCQKNHWPTHKKLCKLQAAELHDVALFKDPPPKDECPICFLPMPTKLISCISLTPATISSVPIYDFANANEELINKNMAAYYSCCGKNICEGCVHSFHLSGNQEKCPFCNSNRRGKTDEDLIEEIRKRVEANDPVSMYLLANYYYRGLNSLQWDQAKAVKLYARAADLGYSNAHFNLGHIYDEGKDMKKAKFHYGAAAMAGNEVARYNFGVMEAESGNMERAIKHWTIAASAGDYLAMHILQNVFENGFGNRESIDSTLAAYNSSCAEMRSEARDTSIHA